MLHCSLISMVVDNAYDENIKNNSFCSHVCQLWNPRIEMVISGVSSSNYARRRNFPRGVILNRMLQNYSNSKHVI